jgi:hypothetical protein
MDPVHKLLEDVLIGTPIAIPLVIRIHEVAYDEHVGIFTLKWKAAHATQEGAFDEPAEGEIWSTGIPRKRYLTGDLRLSRDVFIENPHAVLALIQEDIADHTAQDITEFMVVGANHLKAIGK